MRIMRYPPDHKERVRERIVRAAGTNAGRTSGAAILALGVLAWLGRIQERRVLRSAVIPVLTVWFAAKSVVAYQTMADAVFKSGVGATVFAFDVLLAPVYGYYFVRLRLTAQYDS